MKISIARFGAVLVALTLCAACSTSRYYDVRYLPAPVEVEVGSEGVSGSQVRALATVLGVARPTEGGKVPAQVEVRLRLENLGTVDAKLAIAGIALVSANLIAFQPGVVTPTTDVIVAPGATQTVDIAFRVPPEKSTDELDWHGLNLRFALEFKGTTVTTGATFSRVEYAPAYYEPAYHFGFGYGYRWR